MQPPADALVFKFSNPRYFWMMYGSKVFDTVAVNSEGIWYLPSKGDGAFLAWSEIANLKDDEMANMYSRLVLTDATGNKRLKLDYHLEDFERLREFVMEHTAATRGQGHTRVFHRSLYYKYFYAFLIVFFLLFAGLLFRQAVSVSLGFLAVAFLGLIPMQKIQLDWKSGRMRLPLLPPWGAS